jgi:hypothetical protein
MTNEGWQMIPRDKRPLPEELDGYERKYEYDPDYVMYRPEQAAYLYDYRREEEQKRERDSGKGTPLYPDEDNPQIIGGRRGFDPDTFDLNRAVSTSKSRPQH